MKLPDKPSAEMLRLRWQVVKYTALTIIVYLFLLILFSRFPTTSSRWELLTVFYLVSLTSVISAGVTFFVVSATSLLAIASVTFLLSFLEMKLRAPAYGVILGGAIFAIWLLLISVPLNLGPPLTINQILYGPFAICVATHLGGLLGGCVYLRSFAAADKENQALANTGFRFGIRQLLLVTVLAAVGFVTFKSIASLQTPLFLQLLGILAFVQTGSHLIARTIRPVVIVAH